jgi:hypothetical protein
MSLAAYWNAVVACRGKDIDRVCNCFCVFVRASAIPLDVVAASAITKVSIPLLPHVDIAEPVTPIIFQEAKDARRQGLVPDEPGAATQIDHDWSRFLGKAVTLYLEGHKICFVQARIVL